MNEQDEKDLLPAFLRLEKEVRASRDIRHLSFVISNHSKRLLPYTQAVVWKKTVTGITITSVSATSAINNKSPYIVWLEKSLVPWLIKHFTLHVTAIEKPAIPETLKDDWNEYLTDHVISCPLRHFNEDEVAAGVLYIHSEAWSEGQLQIVEELQLLYEHAWQLILQLHQEKIFRRIWSKRKSGYTVTAAVALLIGLFMIPIRQTVLAPAEIAPKNPILVNSSIKLTFRGSQKKFFGLNLNFVKFEHAGPPRAL